MATRVSNGDVSLNRSSLTMVRMDVNEIIKAYELLKARGFALPNNRTSVVVGQSSATIWA